ncbi:MAG: alpha,alpha-trehalase TreF [Gammaproteobacteria bacterium]|nr:alpha,alpha-trehalase TreF [Gammaproteobacteria bacterium]
MSALFQDVQTSRIFSDSKTFVDCDARRSPVSIRIDYNRLRAEPPVDLRRFVEANFQCPAIPADAPATSDIPFREHLNALWDRLVRSDRRGSGRSTLIPLPHEYVVPGGRFREAYYWDSYFTMIGLAASGRKRLIESMLDNFAFLIDSYGFVPNGNRTYYTGRSQPPFFFAMVNLYMQVASAEKGLAYLPALRREYDFWMDGAEELRPGSPSHRRVVLYRGTILNRYWDDFDAPRPESYREDVHLAQALSAAAGKRLYRELRAGAESGWDYSSRWFADPRDFASIRTTGILPVDLNSLLFAMESTLSELYRAAGDLEAHRRFEARARARFTAINDLFWNADAGMFQDVDWRRSVFTERVTAASFYPMYFRAARGDLARKQTPRLIDALLKEGGIVTSTYASGQQWDSPNGWPPLQWIAVKGLLHYGFAEQSDDIRRRWLAVNRRVYSNTGKMMEKYDVVDTSLPAGGGEYPAQDGFGWTNGVALGLLDDNALY